MQRSCIDSDSDDPQFDSESGSEDIEHIRDIEQLCKVIISYAIFYQF